MLFNVAKAFCGTLPLTGDVLTKDGWYALRGGAGFICYDNVTG